MSFDWHRQIFDPLRGELAYRDVFDGDLGYQTGNDSVFNPPGATSDHALVSGRIAALRREFRLLNPQLYLRMVAMDETAATVKADVEIGGRTHHVIEVSDGVYSVELFVDAASGRLSKLQTLQNDHIWGDVVTEVTYSDWSAPEGSRLKFPQRVELAIGGKTLRTARRTNLAVNPDFPPEALALPDEPRTEVDQAATKRGGLSSQYLTRWHAMGAPFGDQDQISVVATAVAGDLDVQHLTGGSHHSLAIRRSTAALSRRGWARTRIALLVPPSVAGFAVMALGLRITIRSAACTDMSLSGMPAGVGSRSIWPI